MFAFKPFKTYLKTDVRKNFFTRRVLNPWNDLPKEIKSATTEDFKILIDYYNINNSTFAINFVILYLLIRCNYRPLALLYSYVVNNNNNTVYTKTKCLYHLTLSNYESLYRAAEQNPALYKQNRKQQVRQR